MCYFVILLVSPTCEVFEYPNCDDGRLVADVVRIDKGHTEGLEPRVFDLILRMAIRGGSR